MTCSRGYALRNLITCQPRVLRAANQRRWAQVHDVRFLATTQPRRAILEKYRDKLDAKARQEGLAGIDDLKKAYADKIQDVRLRDAAALASPPPEPAAPSPAHSSAAPAPPPKPKAQSPQPQRIPPLSTILDLPKARALPARELAAVWRLRHATSPHALCAVLPAATFAAMAAQARRSPQFVLPVPHPARSAELHFLQWAFDDADSGSASVLFTQLEAFKLRGAWAAPHTRVTHYTDLVEDKGVVLMRGEVVEGRGVGVEEARWLVMCLQRFYGGAERGEERRRLLEWFGKGDERFSVESLMEEAERFG